MRTTKAYWELSYYCTTVTPLRAGDLINVPTGAPDVRPDETSPLQLAIVRTTYGTGQIRCYYQGLARRGVPPLKVRAHLLCALFRLRGDPMTRRTKHRWRATSIFAIATGVLCGAGFYRTDESAISLPPDQDTRHLAGIRRANKGAPTMHLGEDGLTLARTTQRRVREHGCWMQWHNLLGTGARDSAPHSTDVQITRTGERGKPRTPLSRRVMGYEGDEATVWITIALVIERS